MDFTDYDLGMTITYTTSEARSKFFEVIRRVRNGDTVIVTCRGKSVPEIKPVVTTRIS